MRFPPSWNSVFFEEVEGGTRVTLDVHVMSQTAFAPQYLKGMRDGWAQSLDKFADYIEHNDETKTTRREQNEH